METTWWGLSFIVMYTPAIMGIVYMIAAVTLYLRVKTIATGMVAFGALLTYLSPHLINALLPGAAGRSMQMMAATLSVTLVSLGLLSYARSLPAKVTNN